MAFDVRGWLLSIFLPNPVLSGRLSLAPTTAKAGDLQAVDAVGLDPRQFFNAKAMYALRVDLALRNSPTLSSPTGISRGPIRDDIRASSMRRAQTGLGERLQLADFLGLTARTPSSIQAQNKDR